MRDRARRPVRAASDTTTPGYPTLAQEGVTRRAFLGAALGTGAAAGLDWIAVDPAEARGRLRGKRVTPHLAFSVPLPRPYSCPKSGVVVTGVHGRTSSKTMQRFLTKPSNRQALVRIVRRVLHAHRKDRLSEARVRWRVAGEIRSAFYKLFRSRTKQSSGHMTLTLDWRPRSTS